MNRFFVAQNSIEGGKVVLTPGQARQIRDVLRLKVGDDIIVLDNVGWEYSVRLSAIERSKAVGDLIEKRSATGAPRVHITLFQAMPAHEKFELVLQKCTEVGVCEFVPVITQRSIVRGTTGQNKIVRWRRIITEAAEQSGRGRIPELRQPIKFEAAIKENQISKIKYQDCGVNFSYINEKEVQIACENGILPVSLGKRILRTETAAVVASAIILYELGEMEP
jgi:16S rRNA (uracil1498-N3)-methyltransferase